ncbi:MAG: UvrD-helicase domain-containing protein [Bacteroidales bacterium]|nr:UvrD-helicase domain-containing protein [Bacteroidales bacterium]
MFKVYKASAGSGKTTSLVAEFLALCLLKPDRFRNILAVTFTNNATAEMKERIVKVLNVFAFSPISDYSSSDKAIYDNMRQLNPTLAQLSPASFQQKSQILLHKILYDYPDFSISTIDSFFQRIIRSFAIELDLNMNYEVQIDVSEYYQQTVDLLLNNLSKANSEQAKRVITLVQRQMEDSGNWRIDAVLKASIATIQGERSHEAAKKLSEMHHSVSESEDGPKSELTKVLELISKQVKIFRGELKKLADELIQIVESLSVNPEDFVGKSKGIYSYVNQLKNNLLANSRTTLVQKCIDSDSVLRSPTDKSIAVQPRIREIVDQIRMLVSEIANIKPVEKNSSLLLLLFDLKEIMDEIKLRDNLFFLNETNGRIFDEIKDSDTPYLFEKIGNKYSYFFIDEFQDTSKMQWEDLKPLILNALSGQNQFGDNGETILFGDVKQAIYRFRNGDSTLLNQLSSAEGVRDNLNSNAIAEDDFNLKPLDVNYRSSQTVVDFNNSFFKYLIECELLNKNELLKTYYSDVEQQSSSKKDGFVYVRFRQEEDGEAYILSESMNAIENALSKGYDYKDVAVLSKDRQKGSAIANYLASKGIPVISEDSLLLSSSKNIKLIINTLRYILMPRDLLAKLAIVCHFYPERVGDFALLLAQRDGFSQALMELKDTVDVQKLLEISNLRSYPVFTIVKELLLAYRLDDADVFVTTFLDAVFDNYNKKFADLTQFLNWWDETGCSISVNCSKDADAVTVTTIHKSKGLQYPVVVFPMNSWNEGVGIKQVWIKNDDSECQLPYLLLDTSKSQIGGTKFSDIAEEEAQMSQIDNVNAVYVAHTRASEGMYIIAGKAENGKNYSKYLSQFIQNKSESGIPKEYWFGNKDFKHVRKDIESPDIKLNKLHLSDFTLASSQLTCGDHRTEEQELGIFIHDFLARLKSFPQNDKELEELMQTVAGTMDREILCAVLKRLMSDDDLKPYFSPEARVLNETSILNTDGHIYRPDRIVFLEDEVMVIDYKTGKENEAYQQQLDRYCNLLRQMGYHNVKSRILYLNN